jgi:hypothetical protein
MHTRQSESRERLLLPRSVVWQNGCAQNTLRELSVGLCRGNGMLFRAGLQAVAQASGRSFQAGLAEPTAERSELNVESLCA